MLNKVTVAFDHLDPETWTTYEGEGAEVWEIVRSHNPVWPSTARIYHGTAAVENDVTPVDEASFEKLLALEGEFVVVVYPGAFVAPWAWPYIFAAVLTVAAYLLAPSAKAIPIVAQRNSQASSPNNDLSDRTNRARINGRIPDIFGTSFSTPDLIAAPYKIFENGREVEYSAMCIGRGAFQIEQLPTGSYNVRDAETLIDEISGASVSIYAPYTSPNSDDAPQLAIGPAITHKILNTKRNNGVNGQVLRPPRAGSLSANNDIRFIYPNIIEVGGGLSYYDRKFTDQFVEGDVITLSGASLVGGAGHTEYRGLLMVYPWEARDAPSSWVDSFLIEAASYDLLPILATGVELTISDLSATPDFPAPPGGYDTSLDLSGTFTVESQALYESDTGEVKKCRITLDNAVAVNADWGDIQTLPYQGYKFFNIASDVTRAGFDLDGDYTVVSVSEKSMVIAPLDSQDWSPLNDGVPTPYLDVSVTSTSSFKKYGPFVLDDFNLKSIYANFVALNGLYRDDGTDQHALTVWVRLEVVQIDDNDDPVGEVQITDLALSGSATLKETVASTMFVNTFFTGRCKVWAMRTSEVDTGSGQVVDEVRWRDVYSVSPVTQANFGNVTTIHSVTYATASALAVKERKLNLKVTRKIPTRIGSTSTFTTALSASNDSADIFCAVCLDKYIGNRQYAELDVANIYDTMNEVETYFGHASPRQFNYTFDKDNFSFEETANAIADAAFCVAYRRGNLIKLFFEKETDVSTLLFNHRNKIPQTETRGVSFGLANDYDGVEMQYQSPLNGAVVTVFLPESYAAINPQKVEAIGIQHHLHAYFKIWRIWNKLQYQRYALQFDATDEANLLIKNQRILVSDGTRPYSQEGEVLAINTLTLTLSQPVDFTDYASYSIWLQHYDGIAENLAITAGAESNQVVLATAPRLSLVTGGDKYARTTYIIVGDEQTHQMAFLVTEREPLEKMLSTVKAVNYDARYYANDTDFINELITEDGYSDEGGYVPPADGDTGYLILPTAPVLTSEETASVVTLDWTASTAGTWPVVSYRVYQDDVLVATVTSGLTWGSAELEDGTYEFYVIAVDSKGNTSPASNVVTVEVAAIVITPVNLFILGSDNGIYTSSDASSWTQRTTALQGSVNLCHAADIGVIVAVGTYLDVTSGPNDTLGISTNGTSWTTSEMIDPVHAGNEVSYFSPMACAYSPTLDMIVAVGEFIVYNTVLATMTTGVRAAYSTDGGASWALTTILANGASYGSQLTSVLQSIKWCSELSLFVAVGYRYNGSAYETLIYTSSNGTSWTARTASVTNQPLVSFDWNGSLGIAVGGATSRVILHTSNGTSWSAPTITGMGTSARPVLVSWDANSSRFLASNGAANDSQYASSDGSAWGSPISIVTTSSLRSVAYSSLHSRYVCGFGYTASTVRYKSTFSGSSWTSVSPNTVCRLDRSLIRVDQ